MARTRLLLVAILTVVVPTQVVFAVAAELCTILGDHEVGTAPAHHDHDANAGGSAALAYDHAAHDHAVYDHTDDDASGAFHCGPCATASIAPSPKLSIPALPQGGVVSPLLLSPGNGLPHGLDRPPLAL